MIASIFFLLAALAPTAALERPPVECVQQRPETSQNEAAAEFTAAIGRYVELRRQLEGPQPALTIGADTQQTARARRVVAAALQTARTTARRGDVFTPDVSVWLRHRIQLALRRQGDIGTPMARLEDSGSPTAPVAINAVFALGAGEVQWPTLLRDLPELPRELEYRLVGTELVLLDVDTRVVVDVLAGALPSKALDEGEDDGSEMCAPEALPLLERSPCDAHPELEMCWSLYDRVDVELARGPLRVLTLVSDDAIVASPCFYHCGEIVPVDLN